MPTVFVETQTNKVQALVSRPHPGATSGASSKTAGTDGMDWHLEIRPTSADVRISGSK